jgi:hypothetical protein
MSDRSDSLSRADLPISDSQHVALTTYDAKKPDTKSPPVMELLHPMAPATFRLC